MSDVVHHKLYYEVEKVGKLTLDEVIDLLPPAPGGGVQLEGPQEVRGVLEVGPDSHHLHKNPYRQR